MNYTIKILFSIYLFFNFNFFLTAQTKGDRDLISSNSNSQYLNELGKKNKEAYLLRKKLAYKKAKDNGWILKKNINGGIIELQGIDERGNPIYYRTHNINASKSVSTNKLWKSELNGYELDGSKMIIGEWDAGSALKSHQEFSNTGEKRVVSKDGASSDGHSTHVGGTLIAGGVDELAKGMAYNAFLHSYDWNNDLGEMSVAAANGLLISNHSYGVTTGWDWTGSSWVWMGDEDISSSEDYRFGFYSSSCSVYDDISYNAPYYLIVKSAGNDRGDGLGEIGHPADGGSSGFDCIGSEGNSKNILTVGAVADVVGGYNGDPKDVIITDFSSFGPCDDGRIKPDICGNGINLYSSYNINNKDYEYSSGTSMSSPNVAGSLLLLQEHFYDLYSEFMSSACLKALAIHTADECGDFEGPDYKYGWGLLNSKKAADLITGKDCNSLIREYEYLGDNISFDIYCSGIEPLIFTIVWTDVPGNPVPAQLDPIDKMLVNDLDMTVSDGGTTYYPYVLDGQNPQNAPVKGDNDVDNVEKIFIKNPGEGIYTVNISHEGIITNNSQKFALIVSGIYGECVRDFYSIGNGFSQIDLNWNLNTNGDNTLIVWSNDNIFGQPVSGTVYNEGDQIPGGGTVLSYGSATSYSHTDLRAGNEYYYKAFSHLPDVSYSNGIIAHTTLDSGIPEMLNFVDNDYSKIRLNWKTNKENHKVLLAVSEDNKFGLPEDGIVYNPGQILNNGGEVLYFGNVDTIFTNNNLKHTSTYYYKLWSYIDNKYYSDALDLSARTKVLSIGSISGNVNVAVGSTETYTVEDIPDVTYKWELPQNWTGESYSSSINVNVGDKGGKVIVVPILNGFDGLNSILDVNVSIKMIKDLEEYGIILYPIPTNGIMNLYFLKDYDNVKIIIINTSGRVVYTSNLNNPKSERIDISEQASGVYIIKFILDNTPVSILTILNK